MSEIITTSEVQQNIGSISSSIGEKTFIVTNRGKAKMVLLPYFSGCDDFIDDYFEYYEMMKNKKELKKRFQESADSGDSDLIV